MITQLTISAWRRLVPGLLLCMLLGGMPQTGSADGNDASAAPEVTTKDLDRVFRRSTLQIATPDARLHHFNTWIADDDQRRARGLMFIKQLRPDDSMLFIYPQPQRVAMWMKNTYVPLDIVFVAPDGKVINVARNTEPLSLKTIESGGIALAVIELPAGTAARLKITPGAQVIHDELTAPQP
jgi:uncharacterized membrane protein (UPF0127 family)